MQGGGDVVETVQARALAQVQRRLVERAQWLREQPLALEPDLWLEAREEHHQILNARGWPIAVDSELSKRGVAHFLLHGVPIVREG